MNRRSAISAINRAGALLVFPIDNRKEPDSLWAHYFPKAKMRWEWDEHGDTRLAKLWQLKTELSTTRKVIYAKWYRGRGTYFSLPLFAYLLRAINTQAEGIDHLSVEARNILTILKNESPISTRQIKKMSGLQGPIHAREYENAMKELWLRLLIVAYGEVDDGAFPSLSVGATELIFEDVWRDAFSNKALEPETQIKEIISEKNVFYQYLLKIKQKVSAPTASLRPGKSTSKKPRVVKFEDL
jgi:hypothetical protein